MATHPSAWQSVPLPQRLAWSRRQMWLTAATAAQLPDLTGMRLAAAVHLDIKAAVFLEAFTAAGAQAAVMPVNPATTRDDVARHLAGRMRVFDADDTAGVPPAEACLDWGPTHTLEMGADLTAAAAAHGYDRIAAAIEVTRTGVIRLRDLELPHPVFDLDRVPLKNNVHNRYAVGISTWQAFMSRTNLTLHGSVVLIVGYGEVGSGLARAAACLGARVLVAEESPERRLIAEYEGYETGTIAVLAARADVLVTATGREGVVSESVLPLLTSGCFVLNAGHSPAEIALDVLGPGIEVLPHVTSHRPFGAEILLLSGGHLVNLAAGDGDSLNSFDLTSALMVSAVGWASSHGGGRPPGVHALPAEAWAPSIENY
ncbi:MULTISPECIES: NAD(P)-dependent oxidoreductase [unclassified Streptomyces]|uniref:NAD(P)-dependent oxidoreductase n=1 Tax=unclassified Streptomyces TaxID=2593676 RepID=UPI0036EE01C8